MFRGISGGGGALGALATQDHKRIAKKKKKGKGKREEGKKGKKTRKDGEK